jgi:hypothetical protein
VKVGRRMRPGSQSRQDPAVWCVVRVCALGASTLVLVLALGKLLGVLYTTHKWTHSHGRRSTIAQTSRLLSIAYFCGLEGQSGYACTYRSIYEENKGPTSGLEPPTCSLRVITQALQGLAQECKSRISKPDSLLLFAACCTVLRSRWYQSGVNSVLVFA